MTGESRGPCPILRLERQGGIVGTRNIGRLRYAALRIANPPTPPQITQRDPWVVRAFKNFVPRDHQAPTPNPPHLYVERQSSVGELINTLLRAGYSIKQIRAMYPGLFPYDPQPGS